MMLGSFARPTAKVIKRVDKSKKIYESIKEMAKQQILVGVPEDDTVRKAGEVTNAQLAFIHEGGADAPKWEVFEAYEKRFGGKRGKKKALKALEAYIFSKGDPYWHIPPRPFLEPSVEANLPFVAAQMGEILKAALKGKKALVRMESQKLGLFLQSKAKEWFTDPRNGWLPNSKLIAKLKGSDKPLIDTGQLRNSIHYVLRRKDDQRI